MSHPIPTQPTLKMEDLFTQKVSEDELRNLLKTLFRHQNQVEHILQFIVVLYNWIHIHAKTAAITIEQPQTQNSKFAHFAPGEFQISVSNMGSGVLIDQFPLPTETVDNIVYKNRRIYAESRSLTLRYFFMLSNSRASVSVRPLDTRDLSPVRKKKSSSSSLSSSSSSSPKKKKSLFSLW
jgi:hypothetical protein